MRVTQLKSTSVVKICLTNTAADDHVHKHRAGVRDLGLRPGSANY